MFESEQRVGNGFASLAATRVRLVVRDRFLNAGPEGFRIVRSRIENVAIPLFPVEIGGLVERGADGVVTLRVFADVRERFVNVFEPFGFRFFQRATNPVEVDVAATDRDEVPTATARREREVPAQNAVAPARRFHHDVFHMRVVNSFRKFINELDRVDRLPH